MKVRVYDKERDTYFKSEVYAIVDSGIFEKYLVLVPGTDTFQLFDCFEIIEHAPQHPMLIHTITAETAEGWIWRTSLPLGTELLEAGVIRFNEFRGYSWILENTAVLSRLLRGELIPADESGWPRLDSRLADWNYVETPEDADALLYAAHGFHDSVLNRLDYISGGYVSEDNSLAATDSIRTVTVRIESQWNAPVDLVFEGVIALNLRPSEDGYDCIIFDAALLLKEETVFFADTGMDAEDFQSGATCVKAYSLRWRFVEK